MTSSSWSPYIRQLLIRNFRKIREDPSFDEDNTDSQEVLDDVIIRVTAREYLDTVKVMLTQDPLFLG